jgi:hypothetical protein
MNISIRRYQTPDTMELSRRVQEGFVPLISKSPGFLAYYAIDSGDGTWTSVSVFDTQAEADNSTALAVEWARKNVANLVGTPDATSGKVVAYKVK